jgi:murein DD-endopeptidase MepM/ murein hydrolase activator NlpD
LFVKHDVPERLQSGIMPPVVGRVWGGGGWVWILAGVSLVAGCSLLRGHRPGVDAALRARRLMVPVAGVAPADVHDSFDAPRDGGARRHHAVDIFAPVGTPVLSADDGVVLALKRNRLGGLVIYATDPGGRFVYYYAHLSRYQPDLVRGRRLGRGDVIGYVGTTGNADPRSPHLHFQVMVHPGDERWWTGTPVDPLPYFASAGRRPARP